jgi:hypothetical protein
MPVVAARLVSHVGVGGAITTSDSFNNAIIVALACLKVLASDSDKDFSLESTLATDNSWDAASARNCHL